MINKQDTLLRRLVESNNRYLNATEAISTGSNCLNRNISLLDELESGNLCHLSEVELSAISRTGLTMKIQLKPINLWKIKQKVKGLKLCGFISAVLSPLL